jgi:hypothetical protein
LEFVVDVLVAWVVEGEWWVWSSWVVGHAGRLVRADFKLFRVVRRDFVVLGLVSWNCGFLWCGGSLILEATASV